MEAKVIEIQVCGGRLFNNLADACGNYLECLEDHTDREKIHFCIELPDGLTKSITIRQEGNKMVAYGDFDGLPNFLDYATQSQ